MSPLDQKLARDLWRIKGQAIAIAMVIATGVTLLVMMAGVINSLEETRRVYYERNRLADIFAPVKRAPSHIIRKLAALPGVSAAEGAHLRFGAHQPARPRLAFARCCHFLARQWRAAP